MKSIFKAHPLPPMFPHTMLSYITKDPPKTAEIQWKLMKVCKLFFSKHPIIPISDFKEYYDEMVICQFNDNTIEQSFPTSDHGYKFWITGNVLCDSWISSFLSETLPLIFRCDCEELYLDEVNLTYEEFKLLLSSKYLKYIFMKEVNIIKYFGTKLSFDRILDLLPQTLINFA